MRNKLRVALIFGGQSAEHEVSLASAKNVFDALDKTKYEVLPIYIAKSGKWIANSSATKLLQSAGNFLPPSTKGLTIDNSKLQILNFKFCDVVFPVVHGPMGEDGTIQGLLKLAGIPFVGADVLGSAIGMDKDVQKRLLRDAKIPTAKFVVLTSNKHLTTSPFPFPVFVKPANMGSSVGVTKAKNETELILAIKKAFQFDQKIIIEQSINAREIEISVLGNNDPIASNPGEIIPSHDFYDYEAKYLDENGAKLCVPAKLSKSLVNKAQQLAIKAYSVLCCEGMARVDMFLTSDNKFYVNEINTIPGFTNISMYPKLWQASGISQKNLVDKLISLSLERFQNQQHLKTSNLPSSVKID